MKNFEQNKLPKNWILTTLGTIGIVVSGGTPSTDDPEFWGDEIPWLTPADLSNYENVYISKGNRNITKVGLEYSSARLLPKNSILYSSRAPIGYVAIAKNELATNQGFKNLIVNDKFINPKYVYYYLKTTKELAENMASGTTFLEISASKFKEIPFPLAPIAEQNIIVEKIEELFSELDKSNNYLLRSKQQLENLNQLLIYNSFKNINNIVKLKDISEIHMGQSPDSKTYNKEKVGLPFLQGKKEFTEMYPIIEKWTTNPIRIANQNDILMSVRAPVGDVNIANINCCIGRGLASIRFIGYNKFLFYYLKSIKQEIRELGTGTTFSAISREIISNLNVPLLDLLLQKNLIDELELKLNNNEKNIEDINQLIEKNEILKKKILLEAFCGKLMLRLPAYSSSDFLLEQIIENKALWVDEKNKIDKNKPKFARTKINLLLFIDKKFNKYSFTYLELLKSIKMSHEQLAKEFDILLRDNNIEKYFDNETLTIKYKLK